MSHPGRDCGGAGGRHERLELLGRAGRGLPEHTGGLPEHERAKGELKALVPEDAREAIGHGVRAKRSKAGAISFDLIETEATHAALQ